MLLIKSVCQVLLFSHFCACVWIFLGNFEDGWADVMDDTYFNTYITALYFIVTTITKVGYGDFSGSNPREYVFLCIV